MKRYLIYIACLLLSSTVYAQSTERGNKEIDSKKSVLTGILQKFRLSSNVNTDFKKWDTTPIADPDTNTTIDGAKRKKSRKSEQNIDQEPLQEDILITEQDSAEVTKSEAPAPTLEDRRILAHDGLRKYPDAHMPNVVSFVDSLMNSPSGYEEFYDNIQWINKHVLNDIRRYMYTKEIVAKTEYTISMLSKITEAESMLNVSINKDSVRIMSSELAKLETDRQFMTDKIATIRALLDRYYATTSLTITIIKKLEEVDKDDPEVGKYIGEIFQQYNNGRIDMIREIPYMNGIIDQLFECFPQENGVYDMQKADWAKLAEIKTIIENSRK